MEQAQQQGKSRKRAAVAAVAVAALLALIIGGVWSYLQDSSDQVENKFDTNQVSVDLEETTGSSYNVVPGAEQAKDPKVTGTATLSAYVFVKVNDDTQKLVTYSIADGWKELESAADSENGVKVYYREFTPSTTTDAETGESTTNTSYSYDVLKGNKVSYAASLTNADMKNKSNIKLTFQAYAIQKNAFSTVDAAYKVASAGSEDIQTVTGDQKTTTTINASSKDVVVYSNVDFTVDTDKQTSNVYINGAYDGTVVFDNCAFSDTDYEYLQATMSGDATIVFNDCDFYVSSDAKRVIHVQPAANNTQKLDITITNCNFYTTENITSGTRTSSGTVADYIDLDYIADGSTLTLGGNKFYTSDGTQITAMSSNPGVYFCSTSAHNYAQTAYATMFGYVTGTVTTYDVTNGTLTARSA